MIDVKQFGTFRFAAASSVLAVAMLTGCKSKEQAAVDQAKAQAASSGQAQQVQYIDANGDTNTTTVQPPVAGQSQQVSTAISPAAPGPKPHRTDPVITAVPKGGPIASASATPGSLTAGVATSTDPNSSAYVPSTSTDGPNTPDTPYTAPPAETLSANAPAVNLKVPAGTSLAIRINQHISVKHNHAGDRFSGEVVEPISVDNAIVVPKGTHVSGRIDEAHRRGHFKGRSVLELRLTSMELNGNRYALDTHDNVRTKKGKGKRSSALIGGLTGAGMIIGGIATGGVGLAIGAAAGAGTGTLLAGTTGNRDIEIPAESVMRFRLSDALYVQNPQ